MKQSWRNLGIEEGQKRKNWRARVGDWSDLRISETSEGDRVTVRVSR